MHVRRSVQGVNPVSRVRFGSTVPSMQDRFVGCLLGLAAGDALGCNLETLTPEEIRARHGVHRTITGGRPTPGFHEWPCGAVTDDTDMALLLAESLLAHPAGNPWDLLQRFIGWIQTDPPGTGPYTQEVLAAAQKLDPRTDDPYQAARTTWQRLGRTRNGGLMRCAPVALIHYRDDATLRAVSDMSCKVTHYAPACRASTVGFNQVLASILKGGGRDPASRRDILLAAARSAETIDPATATAIRSVFTLRREQLPTSSETLDTLRVAFWAFYHLQHLEEALVTVVNLGGDTDTNAAVTGALFGAMEGVDAIPMHWRQALLSREAIRQVALRLYNKAHGIVST